MLTFAELPWLRKWGDPPWSPCDSPRGSATSVWRYLVSSRDSLFFRRFPLKAFIKPNSCPPWHELGDAKTGKPCFGSHFRSFFSREGGPCLPLVALPAPDTSQIRPKLHRPWCNLGTPKQGNPVLAHIFGASWLRKWGGHPCPPSLWVRACSATSFSREGGPRLPLVALPAPYTRRPPVCGCRGCSATSCGGIW